MTTTKPAHKTYDFPTPESALAEIERQAAAMAEPGQHLASLVEQITGHKTGQPVTPYDVFKMFVRFRKTWPEGTVAPQVPYGTAADMRPPDGMV